MRISKQPLSWLTPGPTRFGGWWVGRRGCEVRVVPLGPGLRGPHLLEKGVFEVDFSVGIGPDSTRPYDLTWILTPPPTPHLRLTHTSSNKQCLCCRVRSSCICVCSSPVSNASPSPSSSSDAILTRSELWLGLSPVPSRSRA